MKNLLILFTAACAMTAPSLTHCQTLLNNESYLSLTQQSAWLLPTHSIQRQLKISPDQQKAIDATIEQYRQDYAKLFSAGSPTQAQLHALEKQYSTVLLTPLKPDQSDRLHQIALQLKGPEALTQPDVSKTVGLSARKQQEIRAVFDAGDKWDQDYNDKVTEKLMAVPQGADKKAIREAKIAIVKAARVEREAHHAADGQKALAILSPAETARWKELLGQPFVKAKFSDLKQH